jgi:undecaprenyl-phosphate galactose phosphotransferase
MSTQSKPSWIKHVDFMAINLISLILCFLVTFYIKFGSLSALLSPTWRSLLIILCLINILVTLITNPYSGILRRPYYIDAVKLFFLTMYSFVVVAIVFYLFKVGAIYSRITLIATFISYYVVSLLLTRL